MSKEKTEWLNRDKAFADVAQRIRVMLESAERLLVSIPSAPLLRVWTVPHSRNPHFTGRDELFDMLDQHFAPTDPGTTRKAALTQPQAIKGLGGLGRRRSQLNMHTALVTMIAMHTRFGLASGQELFILGSRSQFLTRRTPVV